MSIRFQPGMRALMICRALRGQALGLYAAMLFASACQQAAAPTRGPREVGVVETKQEEIPIFTDFVGTIDGVDNAEIRARVPGYVQEIHYKEGTPIKAGDLLFTLDPVLSQATARQAAGDVAMARAKAMRAKADAERYKELYAKNSATVQEYDFAVASQKATEAEVAAAAGALESANANLSYTKVKSPIDGIAGIRNVSVGSLVGQGEPTLLTTVSRLDTVKVRFPISEQLYIKYAAKLNTLSTLDENRPGQLQLILADGSVYPHKGRLVLVDRAVKASVGSIMLESRFPNPDLTLRPGQFGRVRVLTDKLPNAIAVPQRAVIERQRVQSVLVAKADGTVEARIVQTGPRVGSYWVILKGLKPNEKVLVEGQQKVKPGDKVVTKPAKLEGLTKGPTLQAAEAEAAPRAPAASAAPAAPVAKK